jgi:hypothetical protein
VVVEPKADSQGCVVNAKYWFEIIERPHGRYSWILVERRKSRRLVLARGRSLSSAHDVRDVLSTLKVIAADLEIVDTTVPEQEPIPVPETSFHHVPDVMPLPVGASAAGA